MLDDKDKRTIRDLILISVLTAIAGLSLMSTQFFAKTSVKQNQEKKETEKTVSVVYDSKVITPQETFIQDFLGTKKVTMKERPRFTLKVPIHEQCPDFPTGSEIMASMAILDFYQIAPDPKTFAKKYITYGALEEGESRYGERTYGPHPNDAYLGDPTSQYAYGCYSGTMIRALNHYFTEKQLPYEIYKITNEKLGTAVEMTIGRGVPLCIWVTTDLTEPEIFASWYLRESGDLFQWYGNSHAVVVTGYNETEYMLMDPAYDQYMSYEKSLVASIYDKMGRQAFAVVPRD